MTFPHTAEMQNSSCVVPAQTALLAVRVGYSWDDMDWLFTTYFSGEVASTGLVGRFRILGTPLAQKEEH